MTDLTQQDSKQYGRPDNLKIIPFMKIAKPAAIFSILLTIASIFFIVTKLPFVEFNKFIAWHIWGGNELYLRNSS